MRELKKRKITAGKGNAKSNVEACADIEYLYI